MPWRRPGWSKKAPVEYTMAPEADVIAARLVGGSNTAAVEGLQHLKSAASVLFVFATAEKIGKEWAAKAERFPKRFRPLGEYDFAVTISKPIWDRLTDRQREALVYHELLHCGRDAKGKCRIVPHDVEEFELVVKHYGLWEFGLRQFSEQILSLDITSAVGQETSGPPSPARVPALRRCP